MRRLGQLLLDQPIFAAGLVLILVLSPILSFFCSVFAAAIIVLVTLQQGPKNGAFILLWVAVPAIVSFWFEGITGYDVFFVFCLLEFGLASLLREFSSWDLVLEVMLILALLVLAGIHVLVPDISLWWKAHLMQMYDSSSVLTSLPLEEKQRLATLFSQYATGLLAFYIMLFSFFAVMIGRYWQAILNDSVAIFRTHLLAIRINRWVAWLAILCLVGFLFKVPLFMDSISAIMMPFVVGSLSLLHAIGKQRFGFSVLIGLLYLGLLLVQYIVAPLLAVLALLDTHFNFRQRLSDGAN